MAAAPTGEMLPIGRIGLVGVLGRRCFGVIARRIDKPIESARTGHMRGQGNRIVVNLLSLAALVIVYRIMGRRARFLGAWRLVFRCFAHISEPTPFMSDNANLLDVTLKCKVRRFISYILD
jgi:hypothetical protein